MTEVPGDDRQRHAMDDKAIAKAMSAADPVFHPWRYIVERLLTASRFSPPRLYRILWGQHRRPSSPRPFPADRTFTPLPSSPDEPE